MEYKITRDTLQNDLLYDTLKALSKVMYDLQLDVYVVGALARDIAMEILKMPSSPRRTADLDVAIALKDWSQFELLKEQLLKIISLKESLNNDFITKVKIVTTIMKSTSFLSAN